MLSFALPLSGGALVPSVDPVFTNIGYVYILLPSFQVVRVVPSVDPGRGSSPVRRVSTGTKQRETHTDTQANTHT